MDPVSLTIGILPLVAFAAQTINLARTFISSMTDAPESIQALVSELEILRSNLIALDQNLKSDKTNSLVFPQTSVLRSSAAACETRISRLRDKLKKASESKLKGRLSWPFNEDEHRKLMQDLRAFAQWTHFGLTIDGCALLSRSSEDVIKILENQLQTFDSIRSLEDRTAAVEEALKNNSSLLTNEHDLRVRQEIVSWISDYQHDQRHSDVRSKHVEGTGTWFLERTNYQNWRDELSFPNTLWCHGVQGSGKSVLTYVIGSTVPHS